MSGEPLIKRTVAFVDGQNLFHGAREAFGYTYPNYDVSALAERVCARQGWKLAQVRFYTGIPDVGDNPKWHSFWKFPRRSGPSRANKRRWIKIASAFPNSPASRNVRGINKTDWIRIDRALYYQCLDPRDYRR